ncbi:PLP-dependent aminotransferase family protein [Bacillus salipaludis]|uniref:PLP-dependent aminotransferase family protein n=1 Tax=Bacillus salipaludis TaxID=2547811 RepID=A0A4R5VXD2_9BACI|nr:PLP-dependent aminotransferase family protein [Bacillus salipaludis]MDQ6595311.1 PLP-dependent aminotransferase family protein [Bacillus salipaludis]TDK63853.1 PLP-dependent aminotransferase family protein [Bacillus salipaludis]
MSSKYLKIVEEIKNQLTDGTLVAGSKLPSVRQLSEKFCCSKNTVIKAYSELEKEHLVYAIPQSGYYIVNEFNISANDHTIIDFLSAGPDINLIPYIEFQHCLNQAIEKYKKDIFTYSDHQGFHSLRTEIVKNLQNSQVFTEPDRVVIVSGSQQAIHLLAALPFPNGKKNILIEQPTYFGMIESLQIHQITTFGVELSMNGIDLDRLEYIFKNNDIKFFYIIPRFHNPLGHSYTNNEKKKIVELANKYDVYIVEDDFLGELDRDKKSDPLFSFDTSGRVIYIKSFSKVFLPGLRIAGVVLPTIMIKNFLRYKFSADFNSSVLSQGALDIYLKSGMYNSHLKKIKEVYFNKLQLLKSSCEELLPQDTYFTKPDSGFYLSIYLPENVSAKKLALLLSEELILIDDTDRMFLAEYKKDNLIRLCISQVQNHQIKFGVEKIAQTIALLKNKKNYFHNHTSLI